MGEIEMPIAPSDVRAIAPEYKFATTYPDNELQLHINHAYSQLTREAWYNEFNAVDSYDLAVTYLAAHYLAVSHPEASQSNKIRSWEGGMGVTDDAFLATTRFGGIFKQLRCSQLHTRLPVVTAG